MEERDNELSRLERLAESFSNMGEFTQVMRDSYSRLEAKYDDVNARLERVNELLRHSLQERNRLANYLNNILESISSGVIVTDQAGIINVFNKAAQRMTGIPTELALGQNLAEIARRIMPSLTESGLTHGNRPISSEITLEPIPGIALRAAYTISSLNQPNCDDQPGTVIILYDLSDIRRLEENLKRVSTLAELGQMAATVAHEIRNPLAGISGFTSLLAEDLRHDSESIRLVDMIKIGISRLNVIVENLLDFTRTVNVEKENIDPKTIVEEALAELKAGEQITGCHINIEAGQRKFTARLDPHLYRMIALNLIKNAMQASPDGGQIKINLARSESGEVALTVEDEGPGIPEKAIERIFMPFYTTKSNGTGLGLATVKKLTELHGGRVTAGNRPDGGAVFTVQIPDTKDEFEA